MLQTPSNRRQFLKTSGQAALALTVASRLEAQTSAAAGKKRQIKNGMMGLPGGNLPLEEKFRMIKEAGFDGVELPSGMDRAAVQKAQEAVGLEIPSVVAGVLWSQRLSDPNPSMRERGLELLKQALQDAKAYGATSVLTIAGVVDKHASYADVYARSQEQIRKALPLAEQLGVIIAIENVWNKFLLSPMEAARYVDEFKSPLVGWHFDIGNIIYDGWPEHWIPVLGKRIQKLHFKEFSRKRMETEGLYKGFDVEYLQGDNDWPAIVKALDSIDYKGWAIAEPTHRPPNVTDAERLRQIVQFMNQVFSS